MTPSNPKLSNTQMAEKVADVLSKRAEGNTAGRHIENVLAVAGIAQAMLYGTLEALRHSGVAFGKCEAPDGIPWVTLVIFVGCVLPKTVGRASAGKVWETLLGRLASK